MTGRKVFVSYDHEGDMLEVLWAFREGYFTPTDDERILKRLDDDGKVIGFLIHEMSTLKGPSPVEFELASEVSADDVANVTVREAAVRLGVSERRGAQAGQGRKGSRCREGRRRMAHSHAGRGDTREAWPRWGRRACSRGRELGAGAPIQRAEEAETGRIRA